MLPGFGVTLQIDLGPLAPQHMSELIVGVVLVGIVWFVLSRFVVPAFEKLYKERAEAIQGGLERAAREQEEAAAAKAEYTAKLGEAREEAAKIREDAKAQGAQIVADLRQQGSDEAARLVEQGRTQIKAERQQAATQLRNEVGGLATTLAGKIVGESLDDDQRAKATIDRFISELEDEATRQQGQPV